MGEQFQIIIESIIDAKLKEELKTKEQEYQEAFFNFEQSLNTKFDLIFQNKSLAMEEKIKNEKENFLRELQDKYLLFEQTFTSKLEEMIETKLRMNLKTHIMSIVQQILNSDVDLDENIEKELITKLKEFIENNNLVPNNSEGENILEEVGNLIKTVLDGRQFLNNTLEQEDNASLEQVMKENSPQIHSRAEEEGNTTNEIIEKLKNEIKEFKKKLSTSQKAREKLSNRIKSLKEQLKIAKEYGNLCERIISKQRMHEKD